MLRLMRCTLGGALALAACALPGAAQETLTAPYALIGSAGEERLRLDQLTGRASAEGWLIRSPSSMHPRLRDGREHVVRRVCTVRWAPVRPTFEVAWSSDLPVQRNDGGVWTGRGATLYGAAGARAECGRVRIAIVPEVWYAQNRAFAVVSVDVPGKSGFVNPFFAGSGWSGDLPVRFGNASMLVIEPGQTSLEIDAGPVTVGVATESQWWGPAMRNALIMSNHAAGIPNAYLRTSRPVRSPIGDLAARWMVGALTESRFFDFDARNDMRSLSGLVITLTPRVDSNVTLGAARVVYAPVPGVAALPARFLDAVTRWGEGGDVRAATFGRAAEQMVSLFGRWVLPPSGFEAYLEWARVVLPTSLRGLLLAPQYSQGYTMGVQWLGEDAPRTRAWRIAGELSNLEQPLSSRSVSPPSFYVSGVVPHGYTHRGQPIGAMIGPGSSSQWVAVDRLGRRLSLGGFVGRIRWNNEAFYRSFTGLSIWAHDISLYAGLRASRPLGGSMLSAELTAEQRLNYLFQSATNGFEPDRTFDLNNVLLRFRVEPRPRE